MIKAVLFDLDGVLTTDATGSLTTIRHLGRITGLCESALWNAFVPFNDDLLHGRTSHADVWPRICEYVGRDIDIGLLDDAFESTPMNEPMLRLACSLRDHCRTGIITDNKKDRVDYLKRHKGLDALFEPILVSAECGLGKQQPAIFEHALELLRLAPGQVLFIDNSERNIAVAAGVGMHAVHFDDARNDVPALATLLQSRYGLPAVEC